MKRTFLALVLLLSATPALAAKVHDTTTAVSCAPNPVALNAASSCTATVTDTGAGTGGPISPPAGNVAFSTSGSGIFSPASCTVTPTTGSASACSVSYTPTAGTGIHTITADYGGGYVNAGPGINMNPSSGNTALSVTFPPITITGITPAAGNRGETLTVTVTGTNFFAGATSLALGANIGVSALTVNSSTQLTATLTVPDAAVTGLRDVTVANPAPAGNSDVLTNGFDVRNPVPVINTLTPAAVEEGSGALTVIIDGSGFVSDSVVYFDGTPRATAFINSTRLETSLNATDTATIGSYPVTVVNAAPGGGTSNAVAFSVVASGGSFDTVEPNAALGTTMYTKLAGVAFSADILATEISRLAVEASFTGTVKIELLDASDDSGTLDAGGCRASWTTVQALPDQVFTAADNGRINMTAAYPGALRIARFRISYPATGTPTHVGCSSDAFSIRPLSLALSTPLTNTGSGGTPTHAAGAPFAITATAIPGYDGTPAINTALLTEHAGANVKGALGGLFPAADPLTGESAGGSFMYDEAGSFTLAPGGVYDDTFTAVDQPNDCAAGFSNTLTLGKYGCAFGNTADFGVGRFVPAYFDVEVTDACTADGFTYSGQPFLVVVTARDAGGGVTQNYSGSHARDVTLSDAGDASNFVASTHIVPAADFGVGTFGVANNPATTYAFPVAETAFTTITLRAVNPDGVSSAGHLEESTEIRSGRFVLGNATAVTTNAGSLAVSVQAWQETSPGLFEWAVHAGDTSCTTPVQADFSLDPASFTGNLASGETAIAGLAFGAGSGTLALSAPGTGNDGSVEVLVAIDPWLEFDWNGSGAAPPIGKMAFFEIFSTEQGLIERHEVIP